MNLLSPKPDVLSRQQVSQLIERLGVNDIVIRAVEQEVLRVYRPKLEGEAELRTALSSFRDVSKSDPILVQARLVINRLSRTVAYLFESKLRTRKLLQEIMVDLVQRARADSEQPNEGVVVNLSSSLFQRLQDECNSE